MSMLTLEIVREKTTNWMYLLPGLCPFNSITKTYIQVSPFTAQQVLSVPISFIQNEK